MDTFPRYLVTGGCGFIGSHLVEALLARGCRVRVLDNFSTGRRENLSVVQDRVELVEADVRDRDAVALAARGVEGIVHLAALVSVADSVARPLDNHMDNATGTLHVLLAAREARVKRIVLASTAAVYGNEPTLPKGEQMRPEPASPYAAAKLMGEHYLKIFHRLYNLEAISLRFFNVYGPRQDPRSPYSGVISRFVDALRRGIQPVIYGDGRQTRDFVYVADIVQGIQAALHAKGVADGSVFNIATGRPTSLLDLLGELFAISDRSGEPRFEPARAGDIRHSLASIDAARAHLGYSPAVPLREGLRRLWESQA